MYMSYRLRDGLSYCRIDDQVIFLDIQGDRYFRLSDSMAAAFITFADGGRNSEAEFTLLAKNNILSMEPQVECNQTNAAFVPPPTRSAIELSAPPSSINLASLLEVTTLVLAAWWMLKARSLANVIDCLVSHRRKHTGMPSPPAAKLPIPLICSAANSFRRARLYVPIPTSCILDSIAMTRFLSRRHVKTSLVFGVTSNPFSAHCWVQFGDIVLNDTAGNASSYTAIRIV